MLPRGRAVYLYCVYTIQMNWFPAVGLYSVYIVHCTVCTLYNLTGLLAWLNPRHIQYTCICLGIVCTHVPEHKNLAVVAVVAVAAAAAAVALQTEVCIDSVPE